MDGIDADYGDALDRDLQFAAIEDERQAFDELKDAVRHHLTLLSMRLEDFPDEMEREKQIAASRVTLASLVDESP
jgi:hypothetical protein